MMLIFLRSLLMLSFKGVNSMKYCLLFSAFLISFTCSTFSGADALYVFVKNDSQIDSLSKNEIRRIYLGKAVRLSSGINLTPLDHIEDSKDFDAFYSQIIQKQKSQLASYWSRQIFSGKGRPPKQYYEDGVALQLAKSGRDYIAYSSSAEQAKQFKIVFSIEI